MNPSPHIQKLVDERYDVEIIEDKWLLVKRVPYLNEDLEVRYATLVSDIEMAGNDVKVNLRNHPIYFIGTQPYRIDGTKLNANNSDKKKLHPSLTVDFYFSYKKLNRPYTDYYEKMSHYVHIFSKHAIGKDPTVTFNLGSLTTVPNDFPFVYSDCNSASPEADALIRKFLDMKIAIIGMGGTGAYILDFVCKTPVAEIHLFDGDYLHNKNAFRSPGATSIEDLTDIQRKTDYFRNEYSRLHTNIIPHPGNIKEDNLEQLRDLSFVFISIDKSKIKKSIIAYLESKGIPFVDVGMGIQIVDTGVLGSIRTTLSTKEHRSHVHEKNRIKFGENENNDYSSLPQIAELNALNAAFAVIKWKKYCGFYHDQDKEYHSKYILSNNYILNNDKKA